jgi:hypothetical protein
MIATSKTNTDGLPSIPEFKVWRAPVRGTSEKT